MRIQSYHPFRSAEAKEKFLNFYDMQAKTWPVVSESRTVETSYGQTFVLISGPVDAQPLVLMHGMRGNSLMWEPNIEALSECYRTYAVDNIYDCSRSVYKRPLKNSYDYTNWLDELFSALELGDNINLMGVSLGGWLTGLYTLRFPNRLNKIVLLAPAATVLPLRLEFLMRSLPMLLLPYRYFVKSLFYWAFEDLVKKDETGPLSLDNLVDGVFLGFRCFKPNRLVPSTVFKDKELQNIKVPTLYLVGENEKTYSAQKAVERLNKVAPQIKTEVIPNAGHDLTFAQAEMINKKVLEFLKQP